MGETREEAWVELVGAQEVRRRMGDRKNPYDFGTVAPMTRLMQTHEEIGTAFGRLFVEIMFKPSSLSRAEREMIAGVATAAQDCFY